jgi:hypothetical protein
MKNLILVLLTVAGLTLIAEPAHAAPADLTRAEFNTLAIDQTYAQVTNIIGAPGTVVSYNEYHYATWSQQCIMREYTAAWARGHVDLTFCRELVFSYLGAPPPEKPWRLKYAVQITYR